ncbi:MAG: delta-60 repeat domain-containing protein [Nitrospira sp.]
MSVSAGKKAELARSVVVQSDGKIVIAGPMEHDTAATGDSAPDRDIAIARFDNTGQLDQTFGTNGITRLDPSTEAVSGEAFRGDTALRLTVFVGKQPRGRLRKNIWEPARTRFRRACQRLSV